MSVFDDVLGDAQPGYIPQTRQTLERMLGLLDERLFIDVEKDGFIARCLDIAETGLENQSTVQVVSDLAALAWWTGLPISDDDYGRMGRLARKVYFEQTRAAVDYNRDRSDPAARRAHAVLAGAFVDHAFHSPTRGTFDYVRALAADPENELIEVLHPGEFTETLQTYARASLGPLYGRVRFICTDLEPEALTTVIGGRPRTYHVWCAAALDINISLVALFGPTLMFTCGDTAPIQFADVYWYAHDPAYIEDLWGRHGAPRGFIDNYLQLQSAPFPQAGPADRRTRADHGFGAEETIIVTVGNRLGVDMDQAFVDGVAGLVLANPNCRWLIVGALQEFWVNAFTQVLGDQFSHIPFDPDLASLFQLTDIFANPFRAGGGNTVITAVDSGAVVVTRGVGDAAAWAPGAHLAKDAEGYFANLQALVDDPAHRAAWRAQQRALMNRRLDQDAFAGELKAAVATAYARFEARTPGRLEKIFAQERKLDRLSSGSARLERSKPLRRSR